MPTVLAMTIVAMTFASVGVMVSLNSLRGGERDENTKDGLAAADAGSQIALMRQNTVGGTTTNPCLTPGSGGLLYASATQASGWCTPVTGSDSTGEYSYQVKPGTMSTPMQIVSTGSADGVTRRIELTASSSIGTGVFSGGTLLGLDGVAMDSNSKVYGDVASDKSITLSSNALLCGSASYGINGALVLTGNSHQGGSGCTSTTYPKQAKPLTLPPVQQGDVVTNNSNNRIALAVAGQSGGDVITGKTSNVTWTGTGTGAGKRQLSIKQNTSLTLGGSNYSLCKLTMSSNTNLIVANGATVRIFFDSPESCGLTPDGTGFVNQLSLASNSRIVTTSGRASDLALLFVGSSTIPTRVLLNSNSQVDTSCDNGFIAYGPKSTIELDSNSIYCGGLAGKYVHMDSNAKVRSGNNLSDFVLPGAAPHFLASRFVECNGTVPNGAAPSTGC